MGYDMEAGSSRIRAGCGAGCGAAVEGSLAAVGQQQKDRKAPTLGRMSGNRASQAKRCVLAVGEWRE
jgi:hypothetical protein